MSKKKNPPKNVTPKMNNTAANKAKRIEKDKKEKERAALKRAARIKAGKPVHKPTAKECSEISINNGSWSVQ